MYGKEGKGRKEKERIDGKLNREARVVRTRGGSP
jgi:hypothetical protein